MTAPKLDAEAWAHSYFAGKQSGRLSRAKHGELSRRAAGLPPAAREGVPADARRPSLTDDGVDLSAYLDDCRKAVASGHGAAALYALRACLAYQPDEPLPRWLRDIIGTAVSGWQDRVWLTLEDAFQARLPRTKAEDAHFHAVHSGQINVDVMEARKANVPLDRELFAVIGDQYSCSAATVERMWRAYAALRIKQKE